MIAGYVFLYLPILTLIVFSFNDSKMVTLWGGFSFKWYGVIAHDTEVVNGFLLSMKIALMTATRFGGARHVGGIRDGALQDRSSDAPPLPPTSTRRWSCPK